MLFCLMASIYAFEHYLPANLELLSHVTHFKWNDFRGQNIRSAPRIGKFYATISIANESFVQDLAGHNFLTTVIIWSWESCHYKVSTPPNLWTESAEVAELSRFGAGCSWNWSAVVVVAALPRSDDASEQGDCVQPLLHESFAGLRGVSVSEIELACPATAIQ